VTLVLTFLDDVIATPPGGGSSAHCAACDVTTASHTYLLDVNIFISRIQAKQIPFSSVQFRNVLQCNRHGSLVGNFPDATKYNMRLLKCFAVVLTLLRDKGRFKLACYPGFLKSTIFFRTVSYAVYFLLGISPASNCSWPTFRNPVSVPSSKAGCTV